ncbi:hypothetical protein JF531_07915 [Microbacterium esteraromaticum]|uniref:hypothetical protein n=1 Tax=Microbacterium esteraromaticum TaxID=57043 RepID=UPI001A8D9E2E|nr:hypothetical protein [Microbacterium esteraromaticum]MBN8424445.1 hypothetical protein [Microbacterium esteraromaticum]
MTASRMRIVLSALALAGATLLVAGCSATPESPAPTSTDGGTATTTPDDDVIGDDVEAAWLDGGRAIGIVTWGSSSCVPIVDDVSADGQMISVALSDGDENQPCTNDLVPRATFVAVPEGVDVTQNVEIAIAYGAGTEDADLDGLAEAPDGMSENGPSAGWFADDGVVLLTWGSSTCQPIIEDIEQSDAGATVTFQAIDRPCTMDFVPRLTTITLPMEHVDGPFELTLVGDNLDATVSVQD